MIYLMKHIEPIGPKEAQLCLEGISSYASEDGVPFVNGAALRQRLEYKRAFDESWNSIDEPALTRPEEQESVEEPVEALTESVPERNVPVIRPAVTSAETRPCIVCGTPFAAQRKHARYCSGKCRQRAVRAVAA